MLDKTTVFRANFSFVFANSYTHVDTQGDMNTHTAAGTSSYYFCVISLVSRMHDGIGCLLMQRAS